jgi:methyl-accepting chemotaxis protein
MFFSRFKIGVKLAIIFAVLVVMTALAGGFAVQQMSTINRDTQDLADNWLPSVQYLGEMQFFLSESRSAELLHAMAVAPEDKQTEFQKLQTNQQGLVKAGEKFRGLLNPGAEQALWETYSAKLKAYYETRTKLLALSDVGPAEMDATTIYLRGDSRAAYYAVLDSMAKMTQANVMGAGLARESAGHTYDNARAATVAVVLVAVVLAVLLGVWVIRQITRPLAQAVLAAQGFAAGDLTQVMRTEGSDEPAQLLRAMESMRGNLSQVVANVRQGSESVASASAEIAQGNNDASRKIADIISVIDGIAFQTNILALNAAVEAARAGEQGRGFAVVASEVRSLAGRSAEAAKEIKTLINASVERVEQGTSLVDKAGSTMSEVVASIKRVTDIMGEISAASNEQSAGVSQVGEAVAQMDQTTQQNAALVEQMAAAASSLKSQASDLVQVVAVFKLSEAEHSGSKPMTPVAEVPAVRSNKPSPALVSAERRTVTATSTATTKAKGSAAIKPAALPKKTAPVITAAAPRTSTRVTPAGGDDDWETF